MNMNMNTTNTTIGETLVPGNSPQLEEISEQTTKEPINMEGEQNDVIVNDTGVVIDDNNIDQMEEDLLNYDSDNDMAEASSGEDDEEDPNIRQVARNLLQKPANKVLITFENDAFLLFDYNDMEGNTAVDEDPTSTYPIICRNNDINNEPSNILMSSVRHFLESYYNKIKFATKEILINFPALDITLCEDNMYNNQISFEDIQTVFKILKSRSEESNEPNVPTCLVGNIELGPRFVSRYNTLVELTESTATLKNIRPFSNDESHPVLLDDLNADSNEVVVMNIDDDSDGESKPNESLELQVNNSEEMNKKLFVTSDEHDTTNNDEDDLLEIVSDTEEPN